MPSSKTGGTYLVLTPRSTRHGVLPNQIKSREDVFNYVLNGVGDEGIISLVEVIALGKMEIYVRSKAEENLTASGITPPDDTLIDNLFSIHSINEIYSYTKTELELHKQMVLVDHIQPKSFGKNVFAGVVGNLCFAAIPFVFFIILFVIGAIGSKPALQILIDWLNTIISVLEKLKQ